MLKTHQFNYPSGQLGDLQEENDDLKKKIKQLEEAITEYQVHWFSYT